MNRAKLRIRTLFFFFTLAALLWGCASERRPPRPPALSSAQARSLIHQSLPAKLSDRAGWTDDIYAGFTALAIDPSPERICAVVAVIEQESGFHVDPVIPNLPSIAWHEIDDRAAAAGVPRVLVHAVLKLDSSTGRSYGDRIDGARTEKELSDIYEDFIGAVPMGRTLFADHDPIRTRGPMQVHVVFAREFAAARPYPYPVRQSIADEVFTRRGGVYFGIAHLLAYPADYDRFLYRFADFNAGQYASRNAAFQRAVAIASGLPVTTDGALLPHGEATRSGSTEAALRTLAARLDLSDDAIHAALERGKSPDFEHAALYERLYGLAERSARRSLPRAVIPQIELHGPKLSRHLTTEWYANRVDGRFGACLAK